MKATLAKHAAGRVLLHLICMLRDGKLCWHWAGVIRELHVPRP